MAQHVASTECLVREAFGLLLDVRRHPEARHLLVQVIAFLKMLVRDPGRDGPPVVLSVRAVSIAKL